MDFAIEATHFWYKEKAFHILRDFRIEGSLIRIRMHNITNNKNQLSAEKKKIEALLLRENPF